MWVMISFSFHAHSFFLETVHFGIIYCSDWVLSLPGIVVCLVVYLFSNLDGLILQILFPLQNVAYNVLDQNFFVFFNFLLLFRLATGEGFSSIRLPFNSTITLDASCKPRLLPVLLTNQLQIGCFLNLLLGPKTPVENLGCYLYFWPTSSKWDVSKTPSLALINLLGKLTECREMFYLLDYQLIIKGYNWRTARWKRYIGQHIGKKQGASRPSTGMLLFWNLLMFTNPEALQSLLLKGFYGGFITWAWQMKSLATGDWSNL